MGYLFTVIGIYTTYHLWGAHTGLAIFTAVLTLYQASSLNEMFKEKDGLQNEDKWQTTINMFSSILITFIFIYSFFM